VDERDRRLLKWIAVSTTFLAAVVAVLLVLAVVQLVLTARGHAGHAVTP
jgi:hypothetical protein